jgi:type I restriction enzyme S subunit
LCKRQGIIVGRKGAYRGVHFSHTPFFVIDTAFYVNPRQPLEWQWTFYEMVRLDINGMDSGSAIPSTSREAFYALPVLVPPLPVQLRYVETLDSCWKRQEASDKEAATLAAIRDALLPKLLSGEVRTADAERLAGGVA